MKPSFLHHKGRKSYRDLLFTSQLWFEKIFEFLIIKCLDWQKFILHYFDMIQENLEISFIYSPWLKKIFEIWYPEIPQINRNLLFNYSPCLKKLLDIWSSETVHVIRNLLFTVSLCFEKKKLDLILLAILFEKKNECVLFYHFCNFLWKLDSWHLANRKNNMIYFFSMIEENFQNWTPEIPQIDRFLLFTFSPYTIVSQCDLRQSKC